MPDVQQLSRDQAQRLRALVRNGRWFGGRRNPMLAIQDAGFAVFKAHVPSLVEPHWVPTDAGRQWVADHLEEEARGG